MDRKILREKSKNSRKIGPTKNIHIFTQKFAEKWHGNSNRKKDNFLKNLKKKIKFTRKKT